MDQDLHPKTEQIALQLAEAEPGPKAQISRALYTLGEERIEAALAEALKIEAAGGLVTANGEGQHTLGGLFFKNLRRDASKDEWRQIRSQAASADGMALPAMLWSERAEAINEARQNCGTVLDISLSAAGRPIGVKRQGDDYLVVSIDSNSAPPPLSAHLPEPPSLATEFKVVVGQMQWRKMQGPIQDPDKDMVAYGYPIPNVKQRAVILFALTTGVQKRLDSADMPLSVTRVKLVVKPGQFVKRGATLVMALECSEAPKSILAEYPDLPQRVVSFMAYVPEKHWRKLTASAEAAERSLSMNGVCFYDPEMETMGVLVQNLHLV